VKTSRQAAKPQSIFVVSQIIVVQTVNPDAIPCHTERRRSTPLGAGGHSDIQPRKYPNPKGSQSTASNFQLHL